MNKVAGHTKGYTVVETMIFLAISGLMLLSAMLLIGNQQRKTQFAATVREFDSKLQSVVSNVATGYYNNRGTTSCVVSGGAITSLSDIGGTSGQNAGCTFIGQVIVPYSSASGSGVYIYSTAGLRTIGTPPKEVEHLYDAQPTLITGTKEDYALNAGVSASIKIVGGSSVGSIGVFTTFRTYSNNLLGSGSINSDLYAITPSPPTNNAIQSALAANPATAADYVLNPSSGIQICLTDGTQVGVIVVNNGSTRTSIGTTCP